MALGMVGGLPVAGVASSVGLSGKGISDALGLTNPLSAGLSVLSALGGLGGTKVDASSAATQSGLGVFGAENVVSKNKPMLDFGEPMQVGLLALAGVALIYLYKKVK